MTKMRGYVVNWTTRSRSWKCLPARCQSRAAISIQIPLLLLHRQEDIAALQMSLVRTRRCGIWSTGLPPSLPPPPTSPVLHFQTDSEDMEDIANAMSDSDGLTFEHDPLDQQHQRFLVGDSSSLAADFMNSDIPFSDDLAMCLDPAQHSGSESIEAEHDGRNLPGP